MRNGPSREEAIQKATTAKQGIAMSHLFTSHEVAQLLQVNPSSINNWVKAGKLHAFRTPGGHRRLQAGSVAKFAIEFGLPIPEPLKGLAVPNILWVDGDAKRAKRLSRLEESRKIPVNIRVVTTLASGLVEFGTFAPDAFILDASADDVPRGAAVKAARARNDKVIIAFVDGQLSPEDEEEASELKVTLLLQRETDIRQLLNRVLDNVVTSSWD